MAAFSSSLREDRHFLMYTMIIMSKRQIFLCLECSEAAEVTLAIHLTHPFTTQSTENRWKKCHRLWLRLRQPQRK